jgi:hypothetical protein
VIERRVQAMRRDGATLAERSNVTERRPRGDGSAPSDAPGAEIRYRATRAERTIGSGGRVGIGVPPKVPELVLQLTRAGFLALLWLFVLVALRVVRSDLYAASGLRAIVPGRRTTTRGTGGGRGRHARQLVVTHGALAGTRVSLDSRPIMLGRADDSTLVLDDDYASTRHAKLSLQGEEWYVEDLGSTNGTYLDRAKVSGPTRVPLGVPIRIGKTVIELRS